MLLRAPDVFGMAELDGFVAVNQFEQDGLVLFLMPIRGLRNCGRSLALARMKLGWLLGAPLRDGREVVGIGSAARSGPPHLIFELLLFYLFLDPLSGARRPREIIASLAEFRGQILVLFHQDHSAKNFSKSN